MTSTSSSTTAVALGSGDGSRLGEGLLIGSLILKGAGMGLLRSFSGTCCERVSMMLVRVAPSGAVKGGQTERGYLTPVHGGFGRIQVCRVARFALGNMDVILRKPCI